MSLVTSLLAGAVCFRGNANVGKADEIVQSAQYVRLY